VQQFDQLQFRQTIAAYFQARRRCACTKFASHRSFVALTHRTCCVQIDVTLVIIVSVSAFNGGCICEYFCLFQTLAVAQNFVVVIRERPLVIFRASPHVIFRQVNVITINVITPGALRGGRRRGSAARIPQCV
jgi:hypothetical protein